jgi:hypothetical protein
MLLKARPSREMAHSALALERTPVAGAFLQEGGMNHLFISVKAPQRLWMTLAQAHKLVLSKGLRRLVVEGNLFLIAVWFGCACQLSVGLLEKTGEDPPP